MQSAGCFIDMIHQDTGKSEGHYFDEEPTLMDWCQDLPTDDFSCQSADPPTSEIQWKLKETSSYGKRSFVLPITFFDIQSNIQLLNECNPLSIQVVDCDKHPWYYKKYTRSSPEKTALDMEEPRKTSYKPSVKLAGVPPTKCIDLTINTFDSYTNKSSETVKDNAFTKVIPTENRTPPVITDIMKKKTHNISKNDLKDDLEKQIACSQMNLSKINLKHNTGLIGLKITQPIKFNNVLESKKNKIKTAVQGKPELYEADQCFSVASKALGLLGTIIVPVDNNQEQSKIVDKDISNKTYECKVSSKSSAQNTNFKPDLKITKKTRIKNKGASFPVTNKTVIGSKLANDSKEKPTLSTQAPNEKSNKHVKIKNLTETAYGVKEALKQTNVVCALVNKIKPLCQLKDNVNEPNSNERATEDTSRSKSPIFPCNKQKLQSEQERRLHLNDEGHVEPKKAFKTANCSDLAHNNIIYFKDCPKSAYEYDTSPRTPKTSRDNVDKNASIKISDSILNETASQQTDSQHNKKDRNGSLNDNNYSAAIPTPQKRVIVSKTVTIPTLKKIKIISRPSNKCKKKSILNLHDNKAIGPALKKIATSEPSAINCINNKTQFQESSMNNNDIQNQTCANVNVHDKNLSSLYQQHFARINKHRLSPKVSEKPAKISQVPLPKTRPPVQTVAPNISLPIQTHPPNKSESNKYPGRIPSTVTSNNNDANLLEQPMTDTVPNYCKVNGVSNNFARHPFCYPTNVNGIPMNMGNPNMCYSGWDSRLHYPIPPFMHPPPLFLPPPPLPSSLEQLKKLVTMLQNCANIDKKDLKKDAINLKANKSTTNPKYTKKKSNNTKVTKEMKHVDKTSDLKNTLQDSFAVQKSKTNQEVIKTPLKKPILLQTANKTDMLPVPKTKSTIIRDNSLKDNLLAKNDTSHNRSNIAILQELSITPISKSSAIDTSYKNTMTSGSNINSMKTNDITLEKKKENALSSSLPTYNINVSQINNNNKRPKPGPLCMKNKTGPFALNNAASAKLKIPTQTVLNAQPKKGYSPPILPIPTFQTLLAPENELQTAILVPNNANPRPSQNLHTPALNKIPNGNSSVRGSRKRLHFEEKDDNEVKKLKKISFEDYKNRSFDMNKCVDLTYDPSSIPGRKYARKSESSCKSVKSLADVVNHNFEHEL